MLCWYNNFKAIVTCSLSSPWFSYRYRRWWGWPWSGGVPSSEMGSSPGRIVSRPVCPLSLSLSRHCQARAPTQDTWPQKRTLGFAPVLIPHTLSCVHVGALWRAVLFALGLSPCPTTAAQRLCWAALWRRVCWTWWEHFSGALHCQLNSSLTDTVLFNSAKGMKRKWPGNIVRVTDNVWTIKSTE